jgi:hypothetical protein
MPFANVCVQLQVAALRAAYVIGHFMNEQTSHALLRALVDGASQTHIAGNPGNVLAYNASYALQSLCSRPKFALESGMVKSLRELLEAGPESLDGLTQPINTAGTVISQNYAAWILADIVSALIASKCSVSPTAQEEIQAVIVAFGEVLVLEDPLPLSVQCIQWACAESLGIINAALKVKADAEHGIWSDILEISRSYLLAGITAATSDGTTVAPTEPMTTQSIMPTVAPSAVSNSSTPVARRLAKMVAGMSAKHELTAEQADHEERQLRALRAATRKGTIGAKGQRPHNQMLFALYKMGVQAGPPLPDKKPGISFKSTYVVGQRAGKFSFSSN